MPRQTFANRWLPGLLCLVSDCTQVSASTLPPSLPPWALFQEGTLSVAMPIWTCGLPWTKVGWAHVTHMRLPLLWNNDFTVWPPIIRALSKAKSWDVWGEKGGNFLTRNLLQLREGRSAFWLKGWGKFWSKEWIELEWQINHANHLWVHFFMKIKKSYRQTCFFFARRCTLEMAGGSVEDQWQAGCFRIKNTFPTEAMMHVVLGF